MQSLSLAETEITLPFSSQTLLKDFCQSCFPGQNKQTKHYFLGALSYFSAFSSFLIDLLINGFLTNLALKRQNRKLAPTSKFMVGRVKLPEEIGAPENPSFSLIQTPILPQDVLSPGATSLSMNYQTTYSGQIPKFQTSTDEGAEFERNIHACSEYLLHQLDLPPMES